MNERLLYIGHKLSAHHFRYNRRGSTVLGICSCGWKSKLMRKEPRQRVREFVCRHDWEDGTPVEVGEIVLGDDGTYTSTIDQGQGEVIGFIRQCRKCYKCEVTTDE